ncbi:MAG: carboxypeptidase-like regulatory domain-containing protein, partial [Cyanobacteria bacterium P01_G01_bin.4]
MRTYSIVKSTLVPLVAAIAVGMVGHPGLAQNSSSTPAPEASEEDTATVQIEANNLGKVVGQITNQAGQPIANARVIVRGARQGDARIGLFQQGAKTDSSGTFELDGGLPGRWLLYVRHPDYEDLDE